MKPPFKQDPAIIAHRKSDHPIEPLILNRWSPRSLLDEPLSQEEIDPLFEAARFAPSCYNEQPWFFLYGKKGSDTWKTLFDLLVPFNQSWCQKAPLLGAILGRTHFAKSGKPSPSFALDTGAAWENMCLEGTSRGLLVHGMGGFDYERGKVALKVPDTHQLLAMFAIGKRGAKELLSPELQAREIPGERKKVSEFTKEGTF